MGWERNRYYTRSRKVGGKVTREYVGCGPLADLIADRDNTERAARMKIRDARKAEVARLESLDALVAELCDLADLAAHAALIAAGFHQHHCGNWRKRRAQHDKGG